MTRTVKTWGGVGDALLLTPALRALKQTRPGTTLRVLCMSPGHFEVLQHNPYVDRLRLVRFGRHALLRAAIAEVVHQARNFARARRITLPLPVRFFMRFELADYGRLQPMLMGEHATEVIGTMLDVQVCERKLDVFLTEREDRVARDTLRPLRNPVAVHITSRSSTQVGWPLSKWEALISRHRQYTFVQLGTKDEPLVTGCVDARGLTLRESFALLKHAKSFIGVASSFSHATNAVGLPGVVLFGPSSPAVWAHGNNINLTANVRCSPCVDMLLGAPCPYDAECLDRISLEQVEHALETQVRVRDAMPEPAAAHQS